ncbi:MAG: DMT family transporter [Clostridia bacterium]
MQAIKLKAMLLALAAALLYAINMPLSKLLLSKIEPVFMASFLYLGAGIGIGIIYFLFGKRNKKTKNRLTKKDLPFTLGMIILDILAPIFLMIGLQTANSANASLLNNFEIVATTVIALVIFKEVVSKRLWFAILLITVSSIFLTVDNFSSLQFSYGSIFVILACVCWGFENNCTRMLAKKNTYEIVILKGIFSGLGSFVVALVIGESLPDLTFVFATLLLGFVAFGLSIFFYIKAQDVLGASKTSAYYATSPFIGTFISFIIFQTPITIIFVISCLIMLVGTIVVVMDTFIINHIHEHEHCVYKNNKLIKSYTHSHPHGHCKESEPLISVTHRHIHRAKSN